MKTREAMEILKEEYANATKHGYHELAEALEVALRMMGLRMPMYEKMRDERFSTEEYTERKEIGRDASDTFKFYSPYRIMIGE